MAAPKYQSVTIVTSAGGAATVYTAEPMQGRVAEIIYTPGTLDTGADLTITGETSGVAILVQANAGTSARSWVPTQAAHNRTDGAATVNADVAPVFIPFERIKVVVAQGGNVTTGSIAFIVV